MNFFRSRAKNGGSVEARGANLSYDITISFLEAALGCTKIIRTTTSKTLSIKVPVGTGDGKTLLLKERGLPGLGGSEAGDALVVVTVASHPVFTRSDDDILSSLGISLPEAILGCEVEVPTIYGLVTLEIPPGANTDTHLRLKGKGIERDDQSFGDQIITLKVLLPKTHDPDLTKFMEHWAKTNAYPVRRYPGDRG
jgi:DnaJ-class molecular chaperone